MDKFNREMLADLEARSGIHRLQPIGNGDAIIHQHVLQHLNGVGCPID